MCIHIYPVGGSGRALFHPSDIKQCGFHHETRSRYLGIWPVASFINVADLQGFRTIGFVGKCVEWFVGRGVLIGTAPCHLPDAVVAALMLECVGSSSVNDQTQWCVVQQHR